MGTGIVIAARTRLAKWLASCVADEMEIHNLHEQLSAMRSQLEAIQQPAESRKKEQGLAVLDQTATVSDEGIIENFRGNAECIQVGKHSYIRGRLLTYAHAGEISIGDWCYVGARTELWSMASISIGNRVLISHNVNIIDGDSHSSDAAERHEHFRRILLQGHPTNPTDVPGVHGQPIVIEDDAWISFGVTILKGVRIGKGSVIAAGSLVVNDVPANSLYRCKVEPIITDLRGGG